MINMLVNEILSYGEQGLKIIYPNSEADYKSSALQFENHKTRTLKYILSCTDNFHEKYYCSAIFRNIRNVLFCVYKKFNFH